VFDVSFDGTREDFIDELVTLIPEPRFDRVFQFASDYPESGSPPAPSWSRTIWRRTTSAADALYIGFPGRTVGRFAGGDVFRFARAGPPRIRIQHPHGDSAARRPVDEALAFYDLRKHVRGNPPLANLLTSPEQPFLVKHGAAMAAFTSHPQDSGVVGFFVWLFAAHAGTGSTIGLFSPSATPSSSPCRGRRDLLVLWLVIVQVKESFDKPDPSEPSWDSARGYARS